MAKALSLKTRIIREAIAANPGKKPKELSEIINAAEARKEDKVEVKPADVANQVQTLKNQKLTTPKGGKPSAKPEATPPVTPAAQEPTKAKATDPADLIDRLFDLADEVGGFEQLKRMVDRIARVEWV